MPEIDEKTQEVLRPIIARMALDLAQRAFRGVDLPYQEDGDDLVEDGRRRGRLIRILLEEGYIRSPGGAGDLPQSHDYIVLSKAYKELKGLGPDIMGIWDRQRPPRIWHSDSEAIHGVPLGMIWEDTQNNRIRAAHLKYIAEHREEYFIRTFDRATGEATTLGSPPYSYPGTGSFIVSNTLLDQHINGLAFEEEFEATFLQNLEWGLEVCGLVEGEYEKELATRNISRLPRAGVTTREDIENWGREITSKITRLEERMVKDRAQVALLARIGGEIDRRGGWDTIVEEYSEKLRADIRRRKPRGKKG
jgi:hypothetical protein